MRNYIGMKIAIVIGLSGGSLVNLGILELGKILIPLPPGVNTDSMESLKAGLAQFEIQHFIFPFLAHAIGTLFGAFYAARIAPGRKKICAAIVGGFFFSGGLIMVIMVPSPLWFSIIDLALAYVPMIWLALRLARVQ